MGGIDLRDETLVVGREPNQLDELAMAFSTVLDRLSIRHVFVSGYVAILAGRARSTEDIDVLVEPFDAETADRLSRELEANGYWGPAMPLSELYDQLANDANVWVAPEGQVSPHLEVKFADDEFDRASLENSLDARIGDSVLPVGPIELQIAYKLYLGTRRDFEDAVHLYQLLGESLSADRLRVWSERLGVQDEYDRLERG